VGVHLAPERRDVVPAHPGERVAAPGIRPGGDIRKESRRKLAQVSDESGISVSVSNEFGNGLRAHIERWSAPAEQSAPPPDPQPQRVESDLPPAPRDPEPHRVAPRADLDAREKAVAAAEAELAFRRRRVEEREAQFEVAVQRVVYRLAEELMEGDFAVVPKDELARQRERRRAGYAA
jgi:hypothetical protein